MLPTMSESGDMVVIAKSNLIAHLLSSGEEEEAEHASASVSMLSGGARSSRWSLLHLLRPKEMTYKRGDVVVAASPQEPTLSVCKRIIGLVNTTDSCAEALSVSIAC